MEREHDGTGVRRTNEPARILVVGGEPGFRADLVGRLNARRHRCTHVNRYDEASTAVTRDRFDLIVLNPALPDGDGLDLAQLVKDTLPATKTIVFSDTGSFGVALRAIHCGALDFIRTPVDLEEFGTRVDAALATSLSEKQREQRIHRLQRICKELNEARVEISDQVDALCSDMLTAYQDLTEQINDVAMASEFRTLLKQELDIEEVLRTTLEYLLTKTGSTNAAVFLPDADRQYSLGAYVNYDCPRESIDRLLDHLCDAICPHMADEHDLVAFEDADEFAKWIGVHEDLLAEAQIVAFSCHHNDECLAVIVLFRNRAQPFDPALAGTLDILRTIFAEQLATIVRVHHRAFPEWPSETAEDDYEEDFGFGFAA